MKDKIVVSQFEYAIMQAANHPDIAIYRPMTDDEVKKERIAKFKDFQSRIKKK